MTSDRWVSNIADLAACQNARNLPEIAGWAAATTSHRKGLVIASLAAATTSYRRAPEIAGSVLTEIEGQI